MLQSLSQGTSGLALSFQGRIGRKKHSWFKGKLSPFFRAISLRFRLHTESGDVKIRRIFREPRIYTAQSPKLENDIWGDGK